MSTKIFVNLPVKDLKRSVDFFTAMGYTFNAQFTDQNATCMIINEHIYVMLMIEPFFKSFTNKEIPDTAKALECIICLSADSREAVDELVGKAVAAGGTKGKTQDHGFMYGCDFADLDGHAWEIMWMDPAAVQ